MVPRLSLFCVFVKGEDKVGESLVFSCPLNTCSARPKAISVCIRQKGRNCVVSFLLRLVALCDPAASRLIAEPNKGAGMKRRGKEKERKLIENRAISFSLITKTLGAGQIVKRENGTDVETREKDPLFGGGALSHYVQLSSSIDI